LGPRPYHYYYYYYYYFLFFSFPLQFPTYAIARDFIYLPFPPPTLVHFLLFYSSLNLLYSGLDISSLPRPPSSSLHRAVL
jgi:hypothetical protein